MRVLIASTPDELSVLTYRAAQVVRNLGWTQVDHDPASARSIEHGLRAIDDADLVLAFVGWRRGPLPPPIQGWDGETPWVAYELRRAFDLRKPVVVLMADAAWTERETRLGPRALMSDFRAELAPLAVSIAPDHDADEGPARLERQLEAALQPFDTARRSTRSTSRTTRPLHPGLTLRTWPPQPYPPEPWPLLLPYAHPDLLAGRERDVDALLRQLARPQPILGLHAVSGVGKSSLLAGGLVPHLRAAGWPVAFDPHPSEAGLAGRLIDDLLSGPTRSSDLDDDLADDLGQGAHESFVALLMLARQRAGRAPVLVLDQVESVLRGDRRSRAVLGTLLAATVQRQPGIEEPPCRWVLAYRRGFHGTLMRWLGDALREARALGFGAAGSAIAGHDAARLGEHGDHEIGSTATGAGTDVRLPHDLARHERFHAWPLGPLGAAPRSINDGEDGAVAAFRAVLETPLSLVDEDGRRRYPWRFDGDGAARLAAAFAAARRADGEAPLVPELQVVLAHLLAQAGHPDGSDAPATLIVPDDPAALIDEALEAHLDRALDTAFPPFPDGRPDRIGRTRALLALRLLADAHGQRTAGRDADTLVRAFGHQGRDVLDSLQSPGVRLVVARPTTDEGTVFTLSHDRLADVIVTAIDGGGRYALDRELLSLARLVALRSALFRSGERQSSTVVSAAQMDAIERHADGLLHDRGDREWWAACRAQRRRTRRRRLVVGGALGGLIAVAAWWISALVAARAERDALLDSIARGAPEAAFTALGAALARDDLAEARILEGLGARAAPLDMLESGMGSVPEPRRSHLVLTVAELVIPWLHAIHGDDTVTLASLVWALDYAPGGDLALAERALALRDAAIAPHRVRHPPPEIDADASEWVSVPAGRFLMGSEADANAPDERPAHPVTVKAFRILDHEVTNAEMRRFAPDHEGADALPAAFVTWHQAVLYAAWLGGRLPSEAEWEHVARAGCAYVLCRGDGTEASTDEVAWSLQTAMLPGAAAPLPQPVRQRTPNPLGVYDLYGNLWEWTADWYAPYESSAQSDPRGPTGGKVRAARGAAFSTPGWEMRPSIRFGYDPGSASDVRGFRPVRPADP